jgi:hypothetical protein
MNKTCKHLAEGLIELQCTNKTIRPHGTILESRKACAACEFFDDGHADITLTDITRTLR